MEGARRGWFVFVVQIPRRCDRDAVIKELAAEGVQSKPYLPAIHLMRYYRERFGHQPGDFPGVRGRRSPLGRAAVLRWDGRWLLRKGVRRAVVRSRWWGIAAPVGRVVLAGQGAGPF